MALNKTPVAFNFSQGLDTKTDPFQVPAGRFLSLENSIFTKGGLLAKRNGYGALTNLPDNSSTYLTTFNGNLTAIGTKLEAFSNSSKQWVNKGSIQPLKLETLPLIRNNTNQSQADTAISPNGYICTVYTDNVPIAGTVTPQYKYAIADATTGQNIIAPALIPTTAGAILYPPKVFLLGQHFVIVFVRTVSGANSLQYVAINLTDPTIITTNTTISSLIAPSSTVNYDGVVANNQLYLAWNGSDGGGAIRLTRIDSTLTQHSTVVFAGQVATLMSVCADTTNSTPVIYATYYNGSGGSISTLVVNQQLTTILAPTVVVAAGVDKLNLATVAQSMVCTILYENSNNYAYDSSVPTHFVSRVTITQAGVVGTPSVVDRSIGLASKAFLLSGTIYFVGIYSSPYQPTYFLLDSLGHVISILAYSNGGSYYTFGLPSVSLSGTVVRFSYFFKDLIQATNKSIANTQAGIYTQTGINLATYNIGTSNIVSAEIGSNLHLSGGFLYMYDGYSPVEHNFFVWPDNVEATSITTGGFLTAQKYYYQATYEWSDNQGNIFRSAPSIPILLDLTSGTGTNKATINVPTLRLTYKISNPVKIVLYRWSTAQQNFYQVTSVTNPILNDPTVDYVAITDMSSDAQIIGNNLIYTTGGVIEDTGTPAVDTMTLFQTRLFLVDAEDKNLLWYSKQVIEATPVEMSDLLTIYIPPTIGVSGSTGPIRTLSAMDDKLIIFKDDAIYYISGTGPDNTGSNSQFTDAIFITAAVGCANQQSIVLQPMGLMFQSDKGIWMLGRDLSTTYIGAAVEAFTQNAIVLSAISVPGTNQIRFTLDSGITLMYDYFYNQWGTFANVPAISSTIFEGLHTYINPFAQVLQETPGQYLDNGNPTLMSFTTSWLNLMGLQGYQRAYYFYLLGTYYSPHKLNFQIAYDYESNPTQSTTLTADNYNPNYGNTPGFYGDDSPYGGNGVTEQWRVFLDQGKCQAVQITMNEIFDAGPGVTAGAGVALSGINMIIGGKKGYPVLRPSRSVG